MRIILLFGDELRVDIDAPILPEIGQGTEYRDAAGQVTRGRARVIFHGTPTVVVCDVLKVADLEAILKKLEAPEVLAKLQKLKAGA